MVKDDDDGTIKFQDYDGELHRFCKFIPKINFSKGQSYSVDDCCIIENLVSIKVFTYIQER